MKKKYFLILCATLLWNINISSSGPLADGTGVDWKPYAQRPVLEPLFDRDEVANTFTLSTNGDKSVNGSWRGSVPLHTDEPCRFYAEYLSKNVPHEQRSVLAQIDWMNNGKRIEQPEFPLVVGQTSDGWTILEGTYTIPKDATTAKIDLIFRWSETGEVTWRKVSIKPAQAPQPRNVKIATVNFRPRNTSGPQENLEKFQTFIEQAAEQGADLICLPEGVTVCGTGKSYVAVSETLPGLSTEFLGKLAKKHNLYIAAGIYEREGEVVYNTSILLDRNGNLMGKYRKVSLPREEIEGGITPGEDYPVFDTDFGKVGMMICWDVQFPEPARRLAANGAEIILLPIWGGNEHLFEARAIENQIYLVSSSYDARTGIWDRTGELVAEAPHDGSIVVHTVDLNERTLWPWLGDYRSRIWREAPISQAD